MIWPRESVMSFAPLLSPRVCLASRMFLSVLLLAVAGFQTAGAYPQSADAPAATVPILVSDFELSSVAPPPKSPSTPALKRQKTKTPPPYEDDELPSVQARRLMDFFAATLVETLQKSGYSAPRTRGKKPPTGVLLPGVFAEPAAENRNPRPHLRRRSPNSQFF